MDDDLYRYHNVTTRLPFCQMRPSSYRQGAIYANHPERLEVKLD